MILPIPYLELAETVYISRVNSGHIKSLPIPPLIWLTALPPPCYHLSFTILAAAATSGGYCWMTLIHLVLNCGNPPICAGILDLG